MVGMDASRQVWQLEQQNEDLHTETWNRLWNTEVPTLVPALIVPLTGAQMFKCLRVCGTFLISTHLSTTHCPFERLHKKVFCFVCFPEYKLGRFSAIISRRESGPLTAFCLWNTWPCRFLASQVHMLSLLTIERNFHLISCTTTWVHQVHRCI